MNIICGAISQSFTTLAATIKPSGFNAAIVAICFFNSSQFEN